MLEKSGPHPDPVIELWLNSLESATQASRTARPRYDYSVTELLEPAFKLALAKRERERRRPPLVSRMAQFRGNVLHQSAASLPLKYPEVGVALTTDLDGKLDRVVTISGALDLWHEGVIYEFKTGKVEDRFRMEALVPGDKWHSYHMQLNFYAYILRKSVGREATGLKLAVEYGDWKASDARNPLKKSKKYGHLYPPLSVWVDDVPLWDDDLCEMYLMERILMHEAADQVQRCDPKETWFDSRCLHWCEVADVCGWGRQVARNVELKRAGKSVGLPVIQDESDDEVVF